VSAVASGWRDTRAGIPEAPLLPEARVILLTAALRACLTRLDDLGDGDGSTAQAGRDALRRAAL
jgi:hypothetical protein